MQNALTNQTVSGTGYINKFLYPGELFIAFEPVKIWTVLGSCVSVILYSPQNRISAICHAQLPEKIINNRKCSDSCPCVCQTTPVEGDFKYVTCSVNYMVNQLMKIGVPCEEMQVSLYGGSNIYRPNNEEDIYKIGENNVKVSLKMLGHYGLRLKHKNVGGDRGRTLRLDSDTGVTSIQIN